MKGDGLVAVPPGVMTVTEPLVAAAGTAVVIFVAWSAEIAAAVPLKFTAVAPARLMPVIVTVVPAGPEAGASLVMHGTPEARCSSWTRRP